MLDRSTRLLPARGVTLSPYPERLQMRTTGFDQAVLSAAENLRQRLVGTRGRHRTLVSRIERLAPRMAAMSDADLKAYAVALRPRLLRGRLRNGPIDEAFALVREATARKIGLRHYPVQLMGGLVLLGGGLAEMQTGEGKTIVGLLPAITVALAGLPVHVVTVNDYLAKRDAETLRPIYEALGLSVGLIQAGQSTQMRRDAYACNVTYCTNKELVFDYLRDRIAGRQSAEVVQGPFGSAAPAPSPQGLLLRGLHFAIIDEADSVLVDEARTPLIISAERDSARDAQRYAHALDIARNLILGEHFRIASETHQVQLMPRGMELVDAEAHRFDGVWRAKRAREELVSQALTALRVFHKDKHYIVAGEKIQIVDEYTGRVMADRSWERGLHQLIEMKEGCPLSHHRESLAQITYQRFFRRYIRLSGMTGTARELAGEFFAIYGLRTHRIPTHRPSRRANLGSRCYRTADEKWEAIAAAAETHALKGRPVLIGTRSVAASETVSELLIARGTAHTVLNARQDQTEAEAVAAAGQASRITVATNMAGRGTDILLGAGVAANGGLHVILSEYHESARIDRQLYGRAGRQGDPGSHEAIVSLQDDLFLRFAPAATAWLRAMASPRTLRMFGAVLRRLAQRAAERHNSKIRRQIVRRDQELDRAFVFAGRPD